MFHVFKKQNSYIRFVFSMSLLIFNHLLHLNIFFSFFQFFLPINQTQWKRNVKKKLQVPENHGHVKAETHDLAIDTMFHFSCVSILVKVEP